MGHIQRKEKKKIINFVVVEFKFFFLNSNGAANSVPSSKTPRLSHKAFSSHHLTSGVCVEINLKICFKKLKDKNPSSFSLHSLRERQRQKERKKMPGTV